MKSKPKKRGKLRAKKEGKVTQSRTARVSKKLSSKSYSFVQGYQVVLHTSKNNTHACARSEGDTPEVRAHRLFNLLPHTLAVLLDHLGLQKHS